MNMSGFTGLLYRCTEWIYKLALVNLIWIGLTIFGLVLFGVGPATAGLYSVLRKWMNGQTDCPIFKTFFSVYKREFLRANLLSWSFIFAFFILYLDFKFISGFTGALHIIGIAFLLSIFFLAIITFMYIFPVNAYFETNVKNCFKTALLIGLSQLHLTLLMIVSTLLFFFLMRLFPGIIPFYGISVLGVILMWFSRKGFLKIEKAAKAPN